MFTVQYEVHRNFANFQIIKDIEHRAELAKIFLHYTSTNLSSANYLELFKGQIHIKGKRQILMSSTKRLICCCITGQLDENSGLHLATFFRFLTKIWNNYHSLSLVENS